MQFRKLNLILASIAFATALAAQAEEEGGNKEGEGKPAAAQVPKEQKEFLEKTQRLNSLTTRIEESEKQFLELVRRKSTEKDPSEKERIIKQMNDVSKDRNKAADDYNKVKSELELRYPDQGEHLNRRYQTQTKKSVEELEGAAGLDELLTRTKKVIEKKFAPFTEAAEEKEKKQAKAKAAPVEEEKPKLRLEK